jgi:hypothetical protein
VWTKNAVVKAVLLVRGRVRGVWGYEVGRGNGRQLVKVRVELFPGATLSEPDFAALDARVGELAATLSGVEAWEVDVCTA